MYPQQHVIIQVCDVLWYLCAEYSIACIQVIIYSCVSIYFFYLGQCANVLTEDGLHRLVNQYLRARDSDYADWLENTCSAFFRGEEVAG